ncbi:hypothetical protein, partial [Brevundimonas sp.]
TPRRTRPRFGAGHHPLEWLHHYGIGRL